MSILVLKPTGDLEIEPPTYSFLDGFYFPITLFILGYIKLSPILCCFKITMSSAHPYDSPGFKTRTPNHGRSEMP